MSELRSHHCLIPEQRTWLLRSVSVVPVNKLLMQELNQLIGIELLTSNFLESFSSWSQIYKEGQMPLPVLTTGQIQPIRLRGAISVIFVSQVSLRVHYFKMKYTSQHFCDKTMDIGGVIALVLGGAIVSIAPPALALFWHPCGRPWFWLITS